MRADRILQGWLWLVLLVGAVLVGLVVRGNALYRWDGVAMQHPDERFLVYTVYYEAVPPDFRSYLTQSCADAQSVPAARSVRVDRTAKLSLDAAATNPESQHCNTLNPRNQEWSRIFVYGTLPTTLMRVVSSALYGPQARPLDIRNVGRSLACLSEVLAILTVYLLARGLTVRPLAACAALVYALAPLPIQLSHFATVDALASPWVVTALALLVRLPRLRWPGWVALGVCIAVAGAMRITLLSLWVLVPLQWVVMRRWPTWAQYGRTMTAGVLSLVVLWLCDPTIWDGGWFEARWLHDVWLAGRLVNGMVDTPPSFQWSWQTPFVYPLTQMAWWGMGPLLFLAAGLGWLWQSVQPRRRVWGLWLWVTLYLLWQGAVFGMTMRYYLPVYGAACVLAMVAMGRLARPWRTIGVSLLVLGTAVMAVGWSGVYATEHPRIVASRWMYAHIPTGATLAVEEWDDVLPLSLSPEQRPQRYSIVSLKVYAADRPAKFLASDPDQLGIIDLLDQADYVILSSARAPAVIRAMPARFPVMQRYYAGLADGTLGFVPVFQAARWPHIGAWQWDTRDAEEAFSVYDHPQVIIYAKTAAYSHKDAVRKLTEPPLWSSVAAVDTRTYRAWPHLGAVSAAAWQGWRAHDISTGVPLWLVGFLLGTLVIVLVRLQSLRFVFSCGFAVAVVGLVLWWVEAPAVVQQIAIQLRSGVAVPLDPWLAGHVRPGGLIGWQLSVWLGQLLGVAAAPALALSGALAVTLCAACWDVLGDRWRALVALLVPVAVAVAVQMLGLWRDGVSAWLLASSMVGIAYAWALRRPDALAQVRRWLWWGVVPLLVVGAALARAQSWQWPVQTPLAWLLVCWPVIVAVFRQARRIWRHTPAQRGVVAAVVGTLGSVVVVSVVHELHLWLVLFPLLVTTGWMLRHGLPRRWGWLVVASLCWAVFPTVLQAQALPWLAAGAVWWGVRRCSFPTARVVVGAALLSLLVCVVWLPARPVDPRVAQIVQALAQERRAVVVVAGADDGLTEQVARALGLVRYNATPPALQVPPVYDWQQLRIARRGQIARVRAGQMAPCAVAGLDIWLAADGTVTFCTNPAPLPTLP